MRKRKSNRNSMFFKHSFPTLQKVKKIPMSNNASEVFLRRYSLKDSKGKPSETIEEAFYRVANHIAGAEKTAKLRKVYTSHFYNLMGSKRFIPNTPTWSGSKTALGQLAACFVLPIEDDMGKERAGIFQTLRDAALIQQVGGGNGFSFSKLRPKKDRVFSSNGFASGPVSFMQIYDSAFENVAQGGTRRGANMAVLRVDHPDIFDFIRCKALEGKIRNFNISVGITDKFMKALKEDGMFDLVNPRDGKIWKTVRAKEIFDEIVRFAHRNGEPGVLFLDTANKQNPVPDQYTLEATNPCGEQWLGPYENCCLGHVNIERSVRQEGVIDWNHLKESVILGTRFLDNVITQNKYVPTVKELKKAALKNRRIGLGFMGLADAMYSLRIRYGSEESLDFASQVTEFIRYCAMLSSIELAKERGPFPGISESIYDPNNFRWEEPEPLVEHKLNLGRPELDWRKITRLLKRHGIRNSAQLTVAPTGTTATVFDVEGYGCEPVFALAYRRNVYQSAGGDENLKLEYVSPFLKRALDSSNLSEKKKREIIKAAVEKGTIQDADGVPREIKKTFVVSADILPEEHVWMQAVIQRFVDNSISKTCNFPEGTKEDDVRKAYFMAWELGCKGLTVYISGSRKEVILEVGVEEEKRDKKESDIQVSEDIKRPRPSVVIGRTHEIQTPFGKAFITVNRNGETGRKPFEVFVNVGKAGSDTAALSESLGRLISGWLRSADDPDKALEEVADQLGGIGGSRGSVGFGSNRIQSIPDAVSKVLYKELNLSKRLKEEDLKVLDSSDRQSPNGNLKETRETLGVFKNASVCPECGNMSLVETEGCVKCYSCSYSRC